MADGYSDLPAGATSVKQVPQQYSDLPAGAASVPVDYGSGRSMAANPPVDRTLPAVEPMPSNPYPTLAKVGFNPQEIPAVKAYKKWTSGDKAGAVHEVVKGETPQLAISALPLAAEAPLATAGMLARGAVGGYLAHKGAEYANLTPGQADLAGDIGGAVSGGYRAGKSALGNAIWEPRILDDEAPATLRPWAQKAAAVAKEIPLGKQAAWLAGKVMPGGTATLAPPEPGTSQGFVNDLWEDLRKSTGEGKPGTPGEELRDILGLKVGSHIKPPSVEDIAKFTTSNTSTPGALGAVGPRSGGVLGDVESGAPTQRPLSTTSEQPLTRSTKENPAWKVNAGKQEELEAANARHREYATSVNMQKALKGDPDLADKFAPKGRGQGFTNDHLETAVKNLTGEDVTVGAGKTPRDAAFDGLLKKSFTPRQIYDAGQPGWNPK